MAVLHFHFFSKVLGMQRQMDVIVPQPFIEPGVVELPKTPWPVLYLLHGGSDDHTMWTRQTSIERYATKKGVAVVMPSSDLGYFSDMAYGPRFFTFLSEELPELIKEFLPNLATDRAHTFAAGLSMGGFGAVKLGLANPERFCAVASLSGMLDVPERYRLATHHHIHQLSFGYTLDDVLESENDLPYQAKIAIEKQVDLPKLYFDCGTEDYLYLMTKDFYARFSDDLNITYHEQSGDHEWGYWDEAIQRVFDWLPVQEEG